MNIFKLITPKTSLVYLHDEMTIRQSLEKMRAHRYNAIPIISNTDGRYLGSVSEGDFLYNLIKEETVNVHELEHKKITKIMRENYMPAMRVDTTIDELVKLIFVQNYVPIVDDRGILMGIVTRRSVMMYLTGETKDE